MTDSGIFGQGPRELAPARARERRRGRIAVLADELARRSVAVAELLRRAFADDMLRCLCGVVVPLHLATIQHAILSLGRASVALHDVYMHDRRGRG